MVCRRICSLLQVLNTRPCDNGRTLAAISRNPERLSRFDVRRLDIVSRSYNDHKHVINELRAIATVGEGDTSIVRIQVVVAGQRRSIRHLQRVSLRATYDGRRDIEVARIEYCLLVLLTWLRDVEVIGRCEALQSRLRAVVLPRSDMHVTGNRRTGASLRISLHGELVITHSRRVTRLERDLKAANTSRVDVKLTVVLDQLALIRDWASGIARRKFTLVD